MCLMHAGASILMQEFWSNHSSSELDLSSSASENTLATMTQPLQHLMIKLINILE